MLVVELQKVFEEFAQSYIAYYSSWMLGLSWDIIRLKNKAMAF